MAELVFKSDTRHRKQWFTGVSFSHPAKLMLPLQIWLIDNYTKPGDVLLDPMAGSGTVLVACSMGRHVIAVELESKFVDIMKGNWVKVQERGPMMGYQMGTAKIICGDARNLPDILVDKCIFSPPYAGVNDIGGSPEFHLKRDSIGKDNIYTKMRQYAPSNTNIGNLRYGSIDKVITSPAYGESVSVNQGGERESHQDKRAARLEKIGLDPKDYQGGRGRNLQQDWTYGSSEGNLGNLKYGDIDAVITSPPYEGSLHGEASLKTILRIREGVENGTITGRESVRLAKRGLNPNTNLALNQGYSQADNNIGNLKSDFYLAAMLQVYQNCFAVLKPGGLMILVTKNFVRNQKEVRLDEDTIKLCEQAGFILKERHYRKLTSLSFWRTLYARKYPTAPVLNKEDILVFARSSG